MSQRSRKLWVAAALAVLGASVAGLLSGVILFKLRDDVSILAATPLVALLLTLAFLAMLPWWRKLDHMERDSHLTSWYWGGTFGGGLGLLLILFVSGDIRSPLFIGAAIVWLAQAAGYVIGLLHWWIVHRAKAS